ncbi:MAG: type II toxin-antitoxin system death-on-curing family toxin [Verrucomicrobia bacterium]|nr:type II toxin-antitoxin system death-on-curing family toxin [Verrucomicrobiota bacterium]
MARNNEYQFLTLEQVVELHTVSIQIEGGSGGIRDQAVLESAAAAPQATFGEEFLHQSIEEVAAAYLYYLCQNHPFIDGNKRTAIRAALIFLDTHGVELTASIDALEDLTLGVAKGNVGKKEITRFFQNQQNKSS